MGVPNIISEMSQTHADLIGVKCDFILAKARIKRLCCLGININIASRRSRYFEITTDLREFSINIMSALKSDKFIESSGEVTIRRYFPSGRGVTTYLGNHNYAECACIPNDHIVISRPLAIDECGANFIITSGVMLGEAPVIVAESIVMEYVSRCAIKDSNWVEVLTYRGIQQFDRYKTTGRLE